MNDILSFSSFTKREFADSQFAFILLQNRFTVLISGRSSVYNFEYKSSADLWLVINITSDYFGTTRKMSLFVSWVVLACSLLSISISFGQWIEWSDWSTCTQRDYCLEGIRERYRDCESGKSCVGIEAESEMCPDTSYRPHKPDIAYADSHSFIAEECVTTKKFLVKGKYGSLMKHDILRMFPKAKSMLENCYYNFRVTPKTLPGEKNIYRYCFEPKENTITLEDLKSMIKMGSLRYKFASLQCPFPRASEPRYVTGFGLGFQETGQAYGVYIQVKAQKGFKTVYYKHFSGTYSDAYHLIWS
ncbi:uncharacterized protein LOC114515981 isoform X2 [Dendronephthya gigantea]|uniref:uncharacterized protein LOC114515981 isoform X2 n=1 Tax=Dendronephthya gigantea TaxID=151771 RepID=UPI00106AF8F4|nr:uncharacterized protein LOC114515981 isoform X2 [Dendronephthya gigantea]